jgi:hypothetical protein
LAVVGVAILAFALIFAMGSLLATQLTQLAGELPRYQSTISEKIQSFRDTKAGRETLERASDMLKDLGKKSISRRTPHLRERQTRSLILMRRGHRHPSRWKYASPIPVRWRTCGL